MTKDNNNDSVEDIPEMKLDHKYSEKKQILPENTQEAQKEMDKTKKELEKLKNFIVKKYPFTQSISLLPQQAMKYFIDEEEVPKQTEKHLQLYMIVPEEKLKEIPKMKEELVKEIEKTKQKVWLQIKTPVDLWELCLDSKFELVSAISLSYPLHDNGFLSYLRLAEIHKSLVLNKFDKYIVSYVIGGSLVRGDATKTSDMDVFIVINDTDVKKMPRLELKERLRSIIYQYIGEANALAGVKKNVLSPQIYLLTDFWESVKDAHPVMFTFIRDGIPIYDRGTFLPWKALLKMGRLKPSPESIDMFMSMGDKTVKRAKTALLDILVHDIFWGVATPAQALMMLYGLPPPSPKHLAEEFKKTFYEKEKMIELKYVKILEEVVKLFKDYEHERLTEIKGTDIDRLIKDTEDYLKRMTELREQIEKRSQEKTIEEINKDVFELLKGILGNNSQANLVKEFEKLVKSGKFTQQNLRILENLESIKTEFKKGKLNIHKVNDARKDASILINDLIEYTQRKEMMNLEKGRMRLKYHIAGKEQYAELLTTNDANFLFLGNVVKKITNKIEKSSMEEVSKHVEKQKSSQSIMINPKVFEILEDELGKFEIIL